MDLDLPSRLNIVREVSRGQGFVSVSKPPGQGPHQVARKLGIGLAVPLKLVPADKDSEQSAMATTEAERGLPSIMESSPTMALGPGNEIMRSSPCCEATTIFTSPVWLR
jgi:hypothetical protein